MNVNSIPKNQFNSKIKNHLTRRIERFHTIFISRLPRSCLGFRIKIYGIDGSIEGTENLLPCGEDDILATGQQCVSGIVLEPPGRAT